MVGLRDAIGERARFRFSIDELLKRIVYLQVAYN